MHGSGLESLRCVSLARTGFAALRIHVGIQITVAGTIVGVNALLNRETRDALSPAERSYLHEAFQYTGGGLAITALAARTMFKNGFAFRIMSANPWVVLGVSLVGSIGTMMGALYTPPENSVLKHTFWLVSDFVRTVSSVLLMKARASTHAKRLL